MPKLIDVDKKKSEFVAASCAVIASEGLSAATLRRVATEAGCTTGALTHYYPDRKTLLIDTLRSAHFQAGARMLAQLQIEGTNAARLKSVVLESLPIDAKRLKEWKVWLAFWAASMNDEDLAAEDHRRYAEWRELLETLLTPFVKTAQAAEAEASKLMVLIDGIGIGITRHKTPNTDQTALRAYCADQLADFFQKLGV